MLEYPLPIEDHYSTARQQAAAAIGGVPRTFAEFDSK
jgi:hypothetical protein